VFSVLVVFGLLAVGFIVLLLVVMVVGAIDYFDRRKRSFTYHLLRKLFKKKHHSKKVAHKRDKPNNKFERKSNSNLSSHVIMPQTLETRTNT
jgi:hypothetical protein